MTAAANLGSVGEQIAKLIPLLAGEHDGEVLAAARAIGRKLKAAGRDWHWLAAKVAEADGFDVSASTWTPHQRSNPAPAANPTRRTKPKPPPLIWNTLTRFQRLRWLDVLMPLPFVSPADRAMMASIQTMLHLGQSFYLAPRHVRTLTLHITTASARGWRIFDDAA